MCSCEEHIWSAIFVSDSPRYAVVASDAERLTQAKAYGLLDNIITTTAPSPNGYAKK